MSHSVQTTENHGSFRSYAVGFLLSILLTIAPYLLVVRHAFEGWGLLIVLVYFAILQLATQLIFFLHLGKEAKPQWNLLAFIFAAFVVLVVVIGSIWIMVNLNYNMPPGGADQYIIKDEGFKQK